MVSVLFAPFDSPTRPILTIRSFVLRRLKRLLILLVKFSRTVESEMLRN